MKKHFTQISLSFALLLSFGFAPDAGRLLAAEEEAEPEITLSDWNLKRFRFGRGDKIPKKVIAEIKVTNTGQKPMTNVVSQLHYYDSFGEKVKATSLRKVAAIAAKGGWQIFKHVDGFVPAFEAYELHLKYKIGDKDYSPVYRSPDPLSLPKLWSDKPIPGISQVVVVGRDVTQRGRNRKLALYLKVKNLGAKNSKGTKVTVEFFDAAGKIIKSWQNALGNGVIAGGKTVEFNMPITIQLKGYKGYRVKVSSERSPGEGSLPAGEFSDAQEIELAHFKFNRTKKKGELYIQMKVRNGLKTPVKNPNFVINLTGKKGKVKDVPFEVPGTLAPGAQLKFAVSVPDCPSFDGYGYSVSYSKGPTAPPPTTKAKVAPGRVGVDSVTVSKGPDGELRFEARVLSRAPFAVTGVRVIITLLGGSEGKEVGKCAGGLDKLKAGGRATVKAELLKPPAYSKYTYRIKYNEPKPAKSEQPQ
jgi:hypothetical protein